MAKRQPAPVPQLSALPDWVTLDEFAAFERVSIKTIRRRIYSGVCRPMPARKYPYLWRKADIVREFNAPSSRLPHRKHGFAASKARRLAADYADATK